MSLAISGHNRNKSSQEGIDIESAELRRIRKPQGQVRLSSSDMVKRIFAVAGVGGVVVLVLKFLLQKIYIERCIIHNEDPGWAM